MRRGRARRVGEGRADVQTLPLRVDFSTGTRFNRGVVHRAWVVGGVAAVLVFGLLGTCAAIAIGRMDGPPPDHARIPVRIDASLTDEGARAVSETWPIVRSESAPDGSTILGVFDSASDGKSQHVGFALHLGTGASFAQARVRWYDPRGIAMFNSLEWGEGIQGTVTIDADRPPAPGDDRIVAYDLRAMRDDQPVELRGKVRVP